MNALIISGIISCIIAVIIVIILDNIDSAKYTQGHIMSSIILAAFLSGLGIMLFLAGIICHITSIIIGG